MNILNFLTINLVRVGVNVRMDIIFSSLYGEVKEIDIFTKYDLSKIQSL